LSETLKNIAARYDAALRADELLSVPDAATAEHLFTETLRDIKENGRRNGNVRLLVNLLTLCSADCKARVHRAYSEVRGMVAQVTLSDMRVRFPELSEDTAKQIVSETFSIPTDALKHE
jgi:hypothetical protein